MYRQIKGICTCIFLYFSITCTNGLLCYSCSGYAENALDCRTITCKSSLSDYLSACYYESYTPSGYQRRGCGEMRSVLADLNDGINRFYCQEDCCNGYSNVFLNGEQRQYKSWETQAPHLEPSWSSTGDVCSKLIWVDDRRHSSSDTVFIIIVGTCVMVPLIYLCCSMIKSTYQDSFHSFFNTNTAGYRTTDLEYGGNNRNYYSDVSYTISRSNHNNYRDDLYIYGDTNCDGGNDLGSGGNDDSDGDRGAGDCCGGDSGGGDCGGGDSGGGDNGGGDCGGGDCGGGDCGGGDD